MSVRILIVYVVINPLGAFTIMSFRGAGIVSKIAFSHGSPINTVKFTVMDYEFTFAVRL